MFILPGWNSLERTTAIHHIFRTADWAVLILLGIVAMIDAIYSSRQETLQGVRDGQSAEQRKKDEESKDKSHQFEIANIRADYEKKIEDARKLPLPEPTKAADLEIIDRFLDGNYVMEIRPKFGSISPCSVAILYSEYEAGNWVGAWIRDSGDPSGASIMTGTIQHWVEFADGRKIWRFEADGPPVDPTHSMYLVCKKKPAFVEFGKPGQQIAFAPVH